MGEARREGVGSGKTGLEEAERLLAEREREIEALRQSLYEAEKSLAKANEKSERRAQDIERLTGWIEDLEASFAALLGSRRWKVGNTLGDLGRRGVASERAPTAMDSINSVIQTFQDWKGDRKPGTKAGKEASPAPGIAPEGPASHRLGPMEANGIRKVQVGCGPHNLMEDWWNVDIRAFPGIDAIMDATAPWPYEDLDFVFGEHFLEHLTLNGGIKFLTHAGNSLKPAGIMRLSTPNLDWVLHTHHTPGVTDPGEAVAGALRINRAFHGWGHQFLYSEPMLAHLAEEMGFEGFSFFSYGESDTPELQNLERHGKFRVSDGHRSIVVAELRKGERPIFPSQRLTNEVKREYLKYVNPQAH